MVADLKTVVRTEKSGTLRDSARGSPLLDLAAHLYPQLLTLAGHSRYTMVLFARQWSGGRLCCHTVAKNRKQRVNEIYCSGQTYNGKKSDELLLRNGWCKASVSNISRKVYGTHAVMDSITLEDVKQKGLTLPKRLEILDLREGSRKYAFFIHSGSIAAAVQILNNQAIQESQ